MGWSAGELVGPFIRLVCPLETSDSDRIWIAEHLDWRRQIVVKLINPVGIPRVPIALERAAQRLARSRYLDSKHVVHALEHGVTGDGTLFVAMELIDGIRLDHKLALDGALLPSQTLIVVQQVAEALEQAHQANIVHGCLSTDHLLWMRGSEVPDMRVLNLAMSEMDRAATTHYSSPEQYLRQAVDRRTDLWSLAVICYELLTGQRPFDEQSRLTLDWDFQPLSEWFEDLPELLDGWFDRALARMPEDRHQSAAQLADSFAKALASSRQLSTGTKSRVSRHFVIDVGPEPDLSR